MKDNTQEKNLIERNENSIFGKIKNFFKNLFGKKEVEVNNLAENNFYITFSKIHHYENLIIGLFYLSYNFQAFAP